MTRAASLPQTHVHLRNQHARPLPAAFAKDDVRLAESFIEYVLGRFSVPGDRLLDPFAGFGTVLAVAERMGREAWGVEIDPAARVDALRMLHLADRAFARGDWIRSEAYVEDVERELGGE